MTCLKHQRTMTVLNLAAIVFCHAPIAVASEQDSQQRKYLLERVDDVAIVQLYVDGFQQLPLQDKTLVYHLSQAAIAGRDIFIDQKYKHALRMRDLIEEVVTHPGGIDKVVMDEVRRYTKLFWVNNGPHNPITGRKNVLGCSPAEFLAAAVQAEKNGASFSKDDGQSTTQLVEDFQDAFFDPKFESQATNKSPGDGIDILAASANNLYEGVTMKGLVNFNERYALNSKLIKTPEGKLEERVYRAGFDNRIPPGMYAKQLQEVVRHLEAAVPFATPRMARALGALIHYYRTGAAIDFREYNIAWVADRDSPVDTINGFIEVYLDARGQKGSWEAIVYYNDPEKTEMIRRFSNHAQWFEDHMPYARQFRKPNVRGISAKAIQVVMETGDSGPTTPIGINLPNARDIREMYGSKSVSLSNVLDAYDKSSTPASRQEFCLDDAEFQRATKWKSLARVLGVNMHEVIGHASGQLAPGQDSDPAAVIKEYYSALEEARADLVALWFIGDEKLAELHLVEQENLKELQLADYEAYTRNALEQLRRVKEGNQIEEDHMRNRQMIVYWIMDNTDAIDVVKRDGKTYYRVADSDKWHVGVGRLLAEVQRIKSEIDRPAAAKLFEEYGIRFDPQLRDEVLERFAKLNQPSYTGFVMPQLTAVRDADGNITNVRIGYPQSLEKQMLQWSGRLTVTNDK